MNSDVKELYAEIQEVMSENNNDVGDLAVWLIKTYLPSHLSASSAESNDESSPPVQTDGEVTVPRAKPTPLKKSTEQQSLLAPERTDIFRKRAGVDKIKYETLISHIQGGSSLEGSDIGGNFTPDADDPMIASTVDDTPMSYNELSQIGGLVNSSVPKLPANSLLEIERLQRLQKYQELSDSGTIGRVGRGAK